MDARTRAGLCDDVIVGKARPNCPACCGGMDGEVHSSPDFHGFVIPDQRPLNKVVSLAVGIGAPLRGKPLF